MPRLQYPQRAQVPPASGTNNWKEQNVDKRLAWAQPTEEPVNRQARQKVIGTFIAALAMSTIAFVPPASGTNNWKEQNVDKRLAWVQQTGQPVNNYAKKTANGSLISRLAMSTLAFVPPASGTNNWKERILPDKWTPELPDIQFRVRRLQPDSTVNPLYIKEIITPDKWYPELPDVQFRQRILIPAIQAGSNFLGDIPRSETILLDKWYPELPDIQFKQSRRGQPESSINPFVVAEIITIDKWRPSYPDYLTKQYLSRAIQAGSCFLGDIPRAETVKLDKWKPVYPDYFPKPALSRAIQSGSLFLGDIPRAETIRLDKWEPKYPTQLLRIAYRQQPNSSVLPPGIIVTPEVITPDKWYPNYPIILTPLRYVRYPDSLVIPVYVPPIIIPGQGVYCIITDLMPELIFAKSLTYVELQLDESQEILTEYRQSETYVTFSISKPSVSFVRLS